MDGFYLIDKEQEQTSFDVVFKVRKKIEMKKVGHTGTLDPDTTGLLVVASGKATKFIPILSEKKIKKYEAEITFGIHTDTYDISGEVLKEEEVPQITDAMIDQVLAKFIGKQEQIPPIYSAKKVNGKRLYEYARENKEVEIKKQIIEVHSIERTSSIEANKVKFNCCVSKGTYVRSLIVDIAKELQTVGTMSALKRTETDGFKLENAKKIDELVPEDIISLEQYLRANYPVYEVYGKIATLIKNGAKLRYRKEIEYPCLYVDQETNKMIALYDKCDENNIKPQVMLK